MDTMHGILPQVGSTSDLLLELVEANRDGHAVGIPSVCSANRFVLETAMEQAKRNETVVLIESTCNQVNQFGGYTGMRPADFRALVAHVAARQEYPSAGVILGGDHLGPYPWRSEPGAQAMAKARDLVRAYVLANYTKIHLDCSMRLADDRGVAGDPLSEETATARTAELATVAEAAWSELPAGQPAPLYVIGTEVPVPGGEQAAQAGPTVSTVAHAQRTSELCERAFATAGLGSAFQRAVALVVQPGVEFGEVTVFDYRRTPAALELSRAVERLPDLVYEAHSTDYQTPIALRALVEDHFAFLKVGPALTFALREGLFALAAIEDELFGRSPEGRATVRPSHLRETVDRVMREHPEHWQAYYSGDEAALRVARDFSYSDRIRYYWPQAEVRDAIERLIANLSEHAIPPTLLSQYLPDEARAVRAGTLPAQPSPQELIRHKILTVLDGYATACGMH
ncbi:MAG TPA: class II D-tagatose-bisphosphate aldolase, non-catalytic subunit [Thermoleophilia bacterium]|nr:class II D-tagatose-bisphosphate aldolase, non-catalytic subunit [Thermoleophilia bacterium]